jgi:hypothetical protein
VRQLGRCATASASVPPSHPGPAGAHPAGPVHTPRGVHRPWGRRTCCAGCASRRACAAARTACDSIAERGVCHGGSRPPAHPDRAAARPAPPPHLLCRLRRSATPCATAGRVRLVDGGPARRSAGRRYHQARGMQRRYHRARDVAKAAFSALSAPNAAFAPSGSGPLADRAPRRGRRSPPGARPTARRSSSSTARPRGPPASATRRPLGASRPPGPSPCRTFGLLLQCRSFIDACE